MTIARALVLPPDAIILDKQTSALEDTSTPCLAPETVAYAADVAVLATAQLRSPSSLGENIMQTV